MDQVELDGINKYLSDNYGRMDGILPKFRLVWSLDQREKRKGRFKQEHFNALTEEMVMDVPKYAQFDPCYILEKLIPLPYESEIVGSKYSYEPLWTYTKKDKDGVRMDPSLIAIQFLLKHALEGPKK